MEQFFQDIYTMVLHEWVRNQKDNYECYSKEEGVYFQGEHALGIIHFWPNFIIEEEIFDSLKKDRIFYLHFQVNNMNRAKRLIQEFFDFLLQYRRKPKKILLCCTGGVTTTYFAYEMSQLAYQLNMPYHIDATGYTNIGNMQDYDYVILAPQVSYLEAMVKKQFPNYKIIIMEPKTFATHHYLDALKQVDKEVKDYEKNTTCM